MEPTRHDRISRSRHIAGPRFAEARRGQSRSGSPSGSLALARIEAWFRRLDRRRVIAIALALIVGLITQGAVTRARQTVASLGTTHPVAVASTEIEAGAELTLDNIRIEQRPVGHTPVGAISTDASGIDVIGRIAAASIVAGEIVVERRVVSGADAVGIDERAVSIPIPLAPPPLQIGDVVELVGVIPADGPFGATSTRLASGRVIAFDEQAITVATSPAQAMEVITHLGAGAVEVLVTPLDRIRPVEPPASSN